MKDHIDDIVSELGGYLSSTDSIKKDLEIAFDRRDPALVMKISDRVKRLERALRTLETTE